MARKPVKRTTAVKEWTPTLLLKIKAKTENQTAYLKSMADNEVTFGLGKSGTGKTFIAAGFASLSLFNGRVKRIVLTRPMAQCGGNNLGYLPGDAGNKVGPFMAPLMDAMEAFYSRSDVEKMLS